MPLDELSRLSKSNSIEDYIYGYFSEMDLGESEKEKRKQFSMDFIDIMILYFALISTMQEYGSINQKFASESLERDYLKVAAGYIAIDKYIRDYSKKFSEEITDTTLKNIEDEYFLSKERAVIVSVNESNTVGNYGQYSQAIKERRAEKIWLTEGDKHVRESHKEVDGVRSPIDQPFYVGGSLMMFPKDSSMGASASQIVNCRCVARYY